MVEVSARRLCAPENKTVLSCLLSCWCDCAMLTTMMMMMVMHRNIAGVQCVQCRVLLLLPLSVLLLDLFSVC